MRLDTGDLENRDEFGYTNKKNQDMKKVLKECILLRSSILV